MPLTTGNTWLYEEREEAKEPVQVRLTIGETQVIDGEIYYEVIHERLSKVESTYARNAEDGTILGAESEWDFFKYPASNNEEYESPLRSITLTVEQERVTVPIGSFDVWTYAGYDSHPESRVSFAPGIGVVKWIADGTAEIVLLSYDLQ